MINIELHNIIEIHESAHGKISVGMGDDGEQYIRKTSRFDKSAIQLISELDSSYIAKIVEVSDNEIYMEYVDGEILTSNNALPDKIYRIFTELCDAVSALHSVGVIHRDIKPSNIMLTSDGHIKLIDFDAARVKKINQDKDTSFIGTDGFAPPEQYGFEQTDERSDIYALGVTMKLILNDNFEKSPYRSVIEKCLKFSPDQRYSSVLSLKKALAFCKNRKTILLSAVSVAVVAVICVCLSVMSKPAVDIPENVVSDIQTKPAPMTDETFPATTEPVVTTEISKTPTFNEETLDEDLLYWELIPVPGELPKLYDYVSEYSYEYDSFEFHWNEISEDDYNGICGLIQDWLEDYNTFEPDGRIMYQNAEYMVSVEYTDNRLSVQILSMNGTVPEISSILEYSVPADSERTVNWSEIEGIPEDFPMLADSVTAYEDGKIHWDRMSKEELQNIAMKMTDTHTLTSASITETDIIYNFEGDGYRAILHRTNFVSSLKPYQTTLQIVE